MNKLHFLICCICLFLFACKRDKGLAEQITPDKTEVIASYPNFGKLSVGNYWIYRRYLVDSSGNRMITNTIDSCYVSKDTIINGKVFYKMYRPNTYLSNNTFLRDSSGCIIANNGKIIFSPQDFSLVYYIGYSTASVTDTIAKAIYQMRNKDSLITTDLGTFYTTNACWVNYMYPNWKVYGSIRYQNCCYTENIGIVVENLNIIYNYYDIERRLIRYHVN